MNQRIQELAEQADKWSAEEYHQLFLANESPDRQKLFNEKFAELIVRECADIAKHHVMNISTYADAEFVEEQIGKHFGVEE